MQLVNDDIWQYADKLDYICITTNSIVKANGCLTMGAGIAKTAMERNPDLPKEFGDQILAKNLAGKFYGLLASGKYLAFQTKLHYKDEPPLDVVQQSCNLLNRLAKKYPDKSFGLPFPGINNGRRKPSEIFPFLKDLPDNVFVYHINKLEL